MALHCPATVHLVGRDGLADAVAALAEQRVAAVCVGDDPELQAMAEDSAATLGVSVRIVPELGDGPRHKSLATIADLYRGEHVLVLVPGHHQLVALEVGDDGIHVSGQA